MATLESVPEKIDRLFKTIRRPDGREYTYDEVERGTGGAVSRSYIWKLRHGRNSNPSLEVAAALGRYFGVPVTYFFDIDPGSAEPDDAAAVASLIRRPELRRIVEEAQGLSPEALSLVSEWVAGLKQLHK